jgi:hypothetical protein
LVLASIAILGSPGLIYIFDSQAALGNFSFLHCSSTESELLYGWQFVLAPSLLRLMNRVFFSATVIVLVKTVSDGRKLFCLKNMLGLSSSVHIAC